MSKSVAVLGLSKLGKSVAEYLSAEGVEVLVADQNEELVNQFSDKVTYAIVGDLTDPNTLKNLGLSNMDIVIVAMSMNLEASIMSVMISKELKVPRIIAKAKDDRMKEVLLRLGADQIIQPEREFGESIARSIMSSNFIEFFDLTDDAAIVELTPKKHWVGHSLKELQLRKKHGINVLGINDGDKTDFTIDPDQKLKETDRLFLVVEKNNLKAISD